MPAISHIISLLSYIYNKGDVRALLPGYENMYARFPWGVQALSCAGE